MSEDHREPPVEFDKIEPASVRPGTPREATSSTSSAKRGKSSVVWGVAIGVLVVAALAVLTWQPDLEAPLPIRERGENRTDRAAVDVDRALALRASAEKLGAALKARREELSSRALDRWAPESEEELVRAEEEARTLLDAHDLAGAVEIYQTALGETERLLEESKRIFQESLTLGRNALAAGRSQEARDGFDLALAIDPSSEAAQTGARRAATLDRVVAHLAEAKDHEEEGALDAALAAYEKALDLDGESERGRAGARRLRQEIADRDFRRAMSRGLAAIDRGDAKAADVAFQEALDRRPNAPEAIDGRRRVVAIREGRALASLRDRTQALEGEERWAEAVALYDEALAIDGTVAFAKIRRESAAKRAALAQELDSYLSLPRRLEAEDVRRAADSALAEAAAVPEPGPRLRQQTRQLRELLVAARTPRVLTLTSDNQTEVILHHVGPLGRFDERQIELSPGTYTAIGRRPGYRDVRVKFRVETDAAGEPISIRCEEPI